MDLDILKGFRDLVEKAAEPGREAMGGASERLKDFVEEMAARFDELRDAAEDGGSPGMDAPSHEFFWDSKADSVHASTSNSTSESTATVATAVAGPLPDSSAAAGAGKGPMKVDVTVRAKPTKSGDDVRFKMATKAVSEGNGDVSVGGGVAAGTTKPDKLNVKVNVGDWAKEPGDGDTLDFLLLVSGGKGAAPYAPEISGRQKKDIDLVLNINLKGLPLAAKIKGDGLKAVTVGKGGDKATGYIGRADDDGQTVKLVLSPAKGGAPVAVLALDVQADAGGLPNFPDFFV